MTATTLRILIIAPSASRASILEEGLREAGHDVVHHIRDATRLIPRIAAINPDAILIDLETPSRETLEEMLELSRWTKRPVAMFVDQSDSASVRAAIDAGVSAYIVDGLRKERVKSILDVTVSRFHAFNRLETELIEAKAALRDRKLIERAKSLLMKQKGISEAEAYELLRRTAMNENRKLTELAESLVAASALLGGIGMDE